MINSTNVSPIAVTAGDPAGIGPDIILKIAEDNWEFPIVILADKNLLADRAKQLDVSFKRLTDKFSILHVPLNEKAQAAVPNANNAPYIINTLKIAIEGCLNQKFSALVTGPVNKAVINESGFPFAGHTQFLAQMTHTQDTVMMLMTDRLKVALLTDHIPLAQVPKMITKELLISAIKIMAHDFKYRFAISHPRILICGLNPHAGENSYLGDEEKRIMIPAIDELKNSSASNFSIIGPVSADTAFTKKWLDNVDVVLAMYHDQGLPVLKSHGFGHAVNVTLGLPIIRTSVDHGTAYDIAGTGQADPGSLKAAIHLAAQLSKRNTHVSCP